MKKIILVATAALLLLANAAMADSIAGKVGITARGGASYIFNSEFTSSGYGLLGGVKEDIKADIGWTGGAGIMYGITDNLSVNFDVIYFQTDLKMSSAVGAWEEKFGKGKTIDFALGAQWRFMPKRAFVPYIGAGLDVLWNKIDANESPLAWATGTSFDVDPTYGAHLSVGADYFFTPNIALNAEIRGLYSTNGDMTYKYPGDSDFVAAKYNPSNISGFLGIAFYFGGKKEEPTPPPPVQEIKKEAQAAPVVEQKIIEKGRAELRVEFDTGKAIVKPAYYKEIESVADVMKKYPALKIVIEGHTDNVGGENYNLKLSQKRAEAVKKIMVTKYNIDSSRITAKGFGFSKPIASNETKEGKQKNRRIEAAVEYTIVK